MAEHSAYWTKKFAEEAKDSVAKAMESANRAGQHIPPARDLEKEAVAEAMAAANRRGQATPAVKKAVKKAAKKAAKAAKKKTPAKKRTTKKRGRPKGSKAKGTSKLKRLHVRGYTISVKGS
jgi:septal ring-binding cell division protein DamX